MKPLTNACPATVPVPFPRQFRLLLLMAMMVLLTPSACLAQGTVYSSRPAFLNSLTSSTTISFEGSFPFEYYYGVGQSAIDVSGVSFYSSGWQLFIAGPSSPIPGTGQYLWNFDSGIPVTVFFPPGVTAFGADFSGGIDFFPTFNGTVTVNMVGDISISYSMTGQQGAWTFWGINCVRPITSVVYSDGGKPFPDGWPHEEMLDNVTLGPAIPEPTSCWLVFCGLIALRCGRRLRRTR